MSARNVFPPDNEEIDVKPSGTTIGEQAVQPTTTTQINPKAIGSVASFNLVHKVNGIATAIPVTGVRIPFDATRLQILNLSSGGRSLAQWSSGNTVLTAYESRESRDWPQALVTPSTTSTNNQVSYTTATDPTSSSAIWTAIAFTDFTAAQIQIKQPA